MSGVGKITMKLSVTHRLKNSFLWTMLKKGLPGASKCDILFHRHDFLHCIAKACPSLLCDWII